MHKTIFFNLFILLNLFINLNILPAANTRFEQALWQSLNLKTKTREESIYGFTAKDLDKNLLNTFINSPINYSEIFTEEHFKEKFDKFSTVTPFILAVNACHKKLIDFFLDNGADINLQFDADLTNINNQDLITSPLETSIKNILLLKSKEISTYEEFKILQFLLAQETTTVNSGHLYFLDYFYDRNKLENIYNKHLIYFQLTRKLKDSEKEAFLLLNKLKEANFTKTNKLQINLTKEQVSLMPKKISKHARLKLSL